jgi:hypothetical protein
MYTKPLAGICFATALFICAPDSAAPVPPDAVPKEVDAAMVVNGGSSASVASGARLDMKAAGFAPSANVTFALYSEPTVLATAVADSAGVAEASVQVPSLVGAYTVVALGNNPSNGAHVVASPITIEAPGDALPATGTTVGGILGLGIITMIGGAACLRIALTRRRPVHA